MKKHLSVLMLFVRSSIFKILILLTAMSAAELGLFWIKLKSESLLIEANIANNVTDSAIAHSSIGLEYILNNSRIHWVLGITYILMTIILIRSCAGYGGKQVYTFQRLSISEHQVFAWQAFCNVGFYFILWAVQGFVILIMCKIYVNTIHESLITSQTIFLAFYRSSFVHCIIPLEHIGRWFRNIFVVLGMGVSSAYYSYCQRRDKKNLDVVIMIAGVIILFITEMENTISDGLLILLACLWFIRVFYDFRKEASCETN